MKPRPTTIAFAIIAIAITLSTACRSSSSSDKTPTASASAPAQTSAPATAAPSAIVTAGSATSTLGIRALDVKAVPDVQKALTATGGQIVQSSIIYTDVTGDGIDEAIVPISSGGTLGDVGFFVLTPTNTGTTTLLKEFPPDSPGLAVAVVSGKIVMTQPVPAPDDPNCCPSFLRHTTYSWNGSALAIESVTTDPNPAGGGKVTPKPSGASQ